MAHLASHGSGLLGFGPHDARNQRSDLEPMTLARRGGLFIALVPLLVGLGASPGRSQDLLPAGDQVHERLLELSALSGWMGLDGNLDYESGAPLFGVRGILNNSHWWSFEAQIGISPGVKRSIRHGMLNSYSVHIHYDNAGLPASVIVTKMDTTEFEEEASSTLLMVGGDMLFHLSKNRLRPFLKFGGGFVDDISNRDADPEGPLSDGYLSFGTGVKYLNPSGWGWRIDIQDVLINKDEVPRENLSAALIAAQLDFATGGGADGLLFQEPYDPVEYNGRRWLHNIGVSISVSMPFGFAWKDADADGIETRFDECPTTAPSVVVDGVGCGIDSDEDGIFDGLDTCPGTPIGAFVDLVGCPNDIDQDGVFDGIDLLDNTPPGALVDSLGRHYDTDQDGVFDGLDDCNDTPLAANVNEVGCVEDPVEDQFLRGQPILVASVEFEPASDEIDPLSYYYVNRIARLVERWTGNEERPLRVEIGVHSDDRGAESANLDLSQRRADKLRIYLLENYFGIGANNLVAIGYGETKPIADNATQEGREQNRRVEIRFTEEGNAPQEYDFGVSFDDEFDDFDDAGAAGDADASDAQAPSGEATEAVGDLEVPAEIEMPDLDDELGDLDEPEK